MRKRLTFSALFIVVVLVAAVFTAGSQATTDRGKAVTKPAATTVSLNGWVGAKVEDDLLKQVIAAFEKSHPNIKVTTTRSTTTRPRCSRSSPRGNRRTSSTWLPRTSPTGCDRASSSR